MKVAHIITRMIIGGAQENTLFNCLDLAEEYGDQVVLMTGPTEGPEGKLLQRLSDEQRSKIAIQVIPHLTRNIHPLHDWKAYGELKRHLNHFAPDVVHTHSAKAGVLGRIAAWQRRTPAVIHSVHGAPFYDYQPRISYWAYRWFEWYAAKYCHHMISVADAMTDLMVDANIAPREKFTTIYSGMDTRPFLNSGQGRAEARKTLGFQDSDIVVGKIARLAPLKGHSYLLRVAPQLIEAEPRIKFLLVGNGSLTDLIKEEIRRLGLESHFVLTGLVPPEQVPTMISAMDLVVHTSLREGLARVLPQALLSGLPVVSFDIDGAREVCISGETGWLIPPEDETQLLEKLLELVRSPLQRTEMGKTGRERFAQQFDHHYMTRRIRSLYQSIRDQNRP